MNLILLIQQRLRELKLDRLSTRIEVANQYLEAPCHNPVRYAEAVIRLRNSKKEFRDLTGKDYEFKDLNETRVYGEGRLI